MSSKIVFSVIIICVIVLIWLSIYYLSMDEPQYTRVIIYTPLKRPVPTLHKTKERHLNDDQNAHDKAVINYHKIKINKLKELYSDVSDLLDEIENIVKMETNLVKKYKMIRVLKAIKRSAEYIISYGNNDKETYIISLIWKRCVDKNLTQAFLEQLEDCLQPEQNREILQLFLVQRVKYDPNTYIDDKLDDETKAKILSLENSHDVVCPNGRISRLLSTFTLLDPDPILSKPEMDIQEVHNEAYSMASKMRDDKFNDPELKKQYETNDPKITPLVEELKTDIAKSIVKNYKDILDKQSLKNLIGLVWSGL